MSASQRSPQPPSAPGAPGRPCASAPRACGGGRARSPWRLAPAALGLVAGALVVPLSACGAPPAGPHAHRGAGAAANRAGRTDRAAQAAGRRVGGDRPYPTRGATRTPLASASPDLAEPVAATDPDRSAARADRSARRPDVRLADASLTVLRLTGAAERAARARRAQRRPAATGHAPVGATPERPGTEGGDRDLVAARARLEGLAREASARHTCPPLPHAAALAAELAEPVTTPKGRWGLPVTGFTLSAPYGGTGGHWSHTHTGQDFAVPLGTPVRSVGAGEVVRIDCGDAFGISMVVRHGPDTYTHYAHLSAVVASPGERVRPGALIALSGDTGNSTGPHLHFEARRTPDFGSEVDPLRWLRERGVRVG